MSLTASGISVEDFEDIFNPYDLRSAFAYLVPAGMPDGDEDEDGDEDDTDEGDDDAGSAGESSGSEDVKDPEKKRLSDEAAKYRKERNQIRKELDEQKAWRKEQEDKDKSEVEKLTGDVKTLTEERDTWKETAEQLAIQNHVNKVARKFNVSDVDYLEHLLVRNKALELNEDLDIEGLEDKVKELVKEKPTLVASSEDDEDEEEDRDSTATSSGRSVNGKKKTGKEADREALYKKYPALRR